MELSPVFLILLPVPEDTNTVNIHTVRVCARRFNVRKKYTRCIDMNRNPTIMCSTSSARNYLICCEVFSQVTIDRHNTIPAEMPGLNVGMLINHPGDGKIRHNYGAC